MPWNDRSGPVPERSEDELLAVVKSRAARIRRRRVVSASAGAVACLVTVVLAVSALAGSGDGGASSLRVTGPGPSEPATTLPEPSSTTLSTVPPAPSTSSSTPSSVVRPVPLATTATTRPVTTTPTTTPAPTPTTTSTSTTVAPVVACAASEVVVTATPAKAVYASGDAVSATVSAQNRSTHPCVPVDPAYEIRDAAGKSLGGGAVADIFTFPPGPGQTPQPWNPGQTLSITVTWPQMCPPANGPCPPGTYTITATFGPYRSAPAPFTIA